MGTGRSSQPRSPQVSEASWLAFHVPLGISAKQVFIGPTHPDTDTRRRFTTMIPQLAVVQRLRFWRLVSQGCLGLITKLAFCFWPRLPLEVPSRTPLVVLGFVLIEV